MLEKGGTLVRTKSKIVVDYHFITITINLKKA